jgi:hypothetical protein
MALSQANLAKCSRRRRGLAETAELWPWPPQQAMEPSVLSPQAKPCPTSTSRKDPGGGDVWPPSGPPQQASVLSVRMAQALSCPQLTGRMCRPEGRGCPRNSQAPSSKCFCPSAEHRYACNRRSPWRMIRLGRRNLPPSTRVCRHPVLHTLGRGVRPPPQTIPSGARSGQKRYTPSTQLSHRPFLRKIPPEVTST